MLIFSDYTPDGFLALWILSKRFSEGGVLVITENDGATLQSKCEDASYWFPSFQVFRGVSSTEARPFMKAPAAPLYIHSYDFEEHDAPDILFGLAPIWDIYRIVAPLPVKTIWENNPNPHGSYFAKTTAYFYGGLNFGSVMFKEPEHLRAMIQSSDPHGDYWKRFFDDHFLRTVVFEKQHAFGRENDGIFTSETGPLLDALYQAARRHDLKSLWLLDMNRTYNIHLYGKLRNQLPSFGDCHASNITKFDAFNAMKVMQSILRTSDEIIATNSLVAVLFDEPVDSSRLIPVNVYLHFGNYVEYGKPYVPNNVFLFKPKDVTGMNKEVEGRIVNLLFHEKNAIQ